MTTKSWKNHPKKLLRIPQIHFFSLTASTAQMAQTDEFMFQNVAYWPTVYRTGIKILTCWSLLTLPHRLVRFDEGKLTVTLVTPSPFSVTFILLLWYFVATISCCFCSLAKASKASSRPIKENWLNDWIYHCTLWFDENCFHVIFIVWFMSFGTSVEWQI